MCVVRVELGELEAGERCLSELLALLRQGPGAQAASGGSGGPDLRTVAEHLQLVHGRIHAVRSSPQTITQSTSKPLDALTAGQP